MLLALDIGNSQSSIGIFEGSQIIHHWRFETRPLRTSDEYAALLFPLLAQAGRASEPWEGVALCSVVPAVDESVERFFRDYLKIIPLKIDPTIDLGFSLNVEIPSEVGADRLANAAYAVHRMKLPAVVIDLGTATTFDLVSRELAYEGGVILPGPKLAVSALSGGTAKLPTIDLAFPQSVIGKNTVTCIQSGILFGYCDLLDGLLERFDREVKFSPCNVVLTGGLAYLFQSRLKSEPGFFPNLTLEGIELLYRRNTSRCLH